MKESGSCMIVVVSGLPGSGKSYFASRLAKALGAFYLSSDKIRKSMQAMRKYTLEDKMHVYNHMADLTGEHIDKNETVVVDATFYHSSMRDLFLQLAADHRCEIAFILIKTTEELSRQRLSRSHLSWSRTDSESEADLGVYESMKLHFEAYSFPHLELDSGTDNIGEMLRLAEDYLKSKNE